MPHVELPQAEFKVVMLGDTNAGKTSLVLRFAEGYYRDAPRSSTVGAFFITKRIQTSGGITCKVQIWDTAGQKQFRSMAPMYYRNAAAAIVCYDVASKQSFTVMREWLEELHRNVPAGSIVIAIAATKNDLIPVTDRNVLVPTSEGEQLATALGAIFMDTSAKANTNVDDLFRRVAERVLKFRENARRGLSGKGDIPVTPGASINANGKVVKNGAQTGLMNVNADDAELLNGNGNGHDYGEFSHRRKHSLADDPDNSIEYVPNSPARPESPSVQQRSMCDPLGGCGVIESSDVNGSKCAIS